MRGEKVVNFTKFLEFLKLILNGFFIYYSINNSMGMKFLHINVNVYKLRTNKNLLFLAKSPGRYTFRRRILFETIFICSVESLKFNSLVSPLFLYGEVFIHMVKIKIAPCFDLFHLQISENFI